MTEDTWTEKLSKWTVMVYLAGDNNLETFGVKDLTEMKSVGSSQEVTVVAQFDRMSDQVTRRYNITPNGGLPADCVAELTEVNTGDPEALLDFMKWAYQTYPAERHCLILWNHGAGWKDEDIYRIAHQYQGRDQIPWGQIRGLSSAKIGRALFNVTVEQLVANASLTERAILFDDSSADFLDNMELKSVLQKAVQYMGKPLDLLGFDACLMNMLEVHFQIRELCHVVVGSQELEPGDGWPYDAFLARLVAAPNMTPEELAQTIVETYVEFYCTYYPDLSVTQSAVRLRHINAVAEAVDGLANAFIKSLTVRQSLGLIFSALRSAQCFSDSDYVDLAHFCKLLSKTDADGEIGTAAQQVVDLLLNQASPMVTNGHHGPDVTNAHGLSIYLPVRTISPLYSRLEFAQRHHWDEFLDSFVHPR